MRLKLDDNLGRTAAAVFQSAGHDTETVRGEGLSRAADREVITACEREGRSLVTLDLDFGNPLIFNPKQYHGIAVMRLPSKPSPRDLIDTCLTLVAGLDRSPITGKLWIVQRGRLREYQEEEPA